MHWLRIFEEFINNYRIYHGFSTRTFQQMFRIRFLQKDIDLKTLSNVQCSNYVRSFSDILPQYKPWQTPGTLHATKKENHMRVTSDLLLPWQTFLIHEIKKKKQLEMYKKSGLLSMNEDMNFKKLLTQRSTPIFSQVVRMWVGGDLKMNENIIGDQRKICSWVHRTQRIR